MGDEADAAERRGREIGEIKTTLAAHAKEIEGINNKLWYAVVGLAVMLLTRFLDLLPLIGKALPK